jgi:pyruvate oxidase
MMENGCDTLYVKEEMEMQNSFPSRTVAEYLVDQLAVWGVKRIYGVIGDANLHLLNALAKQSQIQYIACQHEMSAALMASAEAKWTGQLTVCTATSGPGLACLLNGLADAAKDKAPVLAITGQVARKDLGTGSKQEIQADQLISPLASYSTTVVDPNALPIVLNQAMKTAIHQGSVAHLAIPKDVFSLPVVGDLFPVSPQEPLPQSPREQLVKLSQVIQRSNRPIILAGRGCKQSVDLVLALATKIQAPIAVTMPAKPLIPNDHPMFAGVLGQAGSEPATKLLAQSDLCLILGATWWPEDYVPDALPTIVQIDRKAEQIGAAHIVHIPIVGDVRSVLAELLSGIQEKRNADWEGLRIQMKAEWEKQIQQERNLSTIPLAPQRVIATLEKSVARDAIIALDVGDHTLWFSRIFHFQKQDLLISGRWRTLGFALPAGISAKLVNPSRQVVVIAGDGGFAYTALELATAVRYGIELKVVILKNGTYAMEQNRMKVSRLQPLGSSVAEIDYGKIAEACGASYVKIETNEELEQLVPQAMNRSGTVVIEVTCGSPIVPHTKV